ncbi:MAG: hydantoinase/oxoprolinase family protein, partial [Candidatus Binatia bacterium]
LVPRDRVLEVPERIDARGRVLLPLDRRASRRALRELVEERGIEALAICLLWSCRNPAHEIALEGLAHELYPDLFVTRSSEVFPVIREYERMTATVLNAYGWRAFSTFMDQMESGLRRAGLAQPIAIMQSSGGTFSAVEARRLPVYLAQSGPVAGVVAAGILGAGGGRANLVTADLGGTSYDVCVISEGEPVTKVRAEIAGLWTGLVMVDVSSIGAGGGSLAWIDSRGMLEVGPLSAGANPGPVCYGRGGETPTLTDALVVLGFIDPDYFLGGRMTLDRAAARRAVSEFGARLGITAAETAAGIYRIALANMTLATRGLLTEKGYDPREFSLVSYGGGGSLFTALIAEELGIREVVVPRLASVFSAFGAAAADVRRDSVRTVTAAMPVSAALLEQTFRALEESVRARTRAGAADDVTIEVKREADLRFMKQIWEVTVPVPDGSIDESAVAAIEQAFLEKYARLYGKGVGLRDAGIELVNCRAVGHGRIRKPALAPRPLGDADPSAAAKGKREVWIPQTPSGVLVAREITLYDGLRLAPGAELAGPSLIELPDTTIFVPAERKARIDEYESCVIAT